MSGEWTYEHNLCRNIMHAWEKGSHWPIRITFSGLSQLSITTVTLYSESSGIDIMTSCVCWSDLTDTAQMSNVIRTSVVTMDTWAISATGEVNMKEEDFRGYHARNEKADMTEAHEISHCIL